MLELSCLYSFKKRLRTKCLRAHAVCNVYPHGCDTIKSVLISYQFEFAIFALFEACECWYSGDKMIMLCPNFVQHQNHSVYQFNKMCLYTTISTSAPSCNCRWNLNFNKVTFEACFIAAAGTAAAFGVCSFHKKEQEWSTFPTNFSFKIQEH